MGCKRCAAHIDGDAEYCGFCTRKLMIDVSDKHQHTRISTGVDPFWTIVGAAIFFMILVVSWFMVYLDTEENKRFARIQQNIITCDDMTTYMGQAHGWTALSKVLKTYKNTCVAPAFGSEEPTESQIVSALKTMDCSKVSWWFLYGTYEISKYAREEINWGHCR